MEKIIEKQVNKTLAGLSDKDKERFLQLMENQSNSSPADFDEFTELLIKAGRNADTVKDRWATRKPPRVSQRPL